MSPVMLIEECPSRSATAWRVSLLPPVLRAVCRLSRIDHDPHSVSIIGMLCREVGSDAVAAKPRGCQATHLVRHLDCPCFPLTFRSACGWRQAMRLKVVYVVRVVVGMGHTIAQHQCTQRDCYCHNEFHSYFHPCLRQRFHSIRTY